MLGLGLGQRLLKKSFLIDRSVAASDASLSVLIRVGVMVRVALMVIVVIDVIA